MKPPRTTQAEMPFLDHLDELRSRLIKCLIALALACVLGLVAVAELDVLGLIERPIRGLVPMETLVYTNPTTPFFITLKLGFIVGLILAFPFLAWQLWAFLSPALYENERKFAIPAIAFGTILFIGGICLAYFFVLPFGLEILLGFYETDLTPLITIDEYLKFATMLILAFGLVFEVPVLLVFLSMVGIVTAEGLSRFRRHAIIVMAILSAFLTPADPFTMVAMMIPLMLLYEGSIVTIRLMGKRREERMQAESEGSPA
ncbi:MAG: twin-arginine translocase subunit TatC [Gemmatimonadota bacterium]|nr:twin-arginine translocase subunit TatC [Gemmatimonadota bacterium]